MEFRERVSSSANFPEAQVTSLEFGEFPQDPFVFYKSFRIFPCKEEFSTAMVG